MRTPFIPILAMGMFSSAFSQTYTIQTFAGGALPENLPGPAVRLGRVSSVAVDIAGNVFAALPDYHIVVRLNVLSGTLTRIAGTGLAPSSGLSSANMPAPNAPLRNPTSVVVDLAGNVYIADGPVVREVSNGIITTVVGGGSISVGDGVPVASVQLTAPLKLAVDPSGNLYIAETMGYCVLKASNGQITVVAGNTIRGYSGDGGPANSAQLGQPEGISIDSSGNLYIADLLNNVVRKVSNGIISTVAGDATQGYSGDSGPAALAALNAPRAVAVDATGNLYIADSGNYRVREVSNGVITTAAGTGIPGYSGDNGPAVSAELNSLQDIAADSAGNLYFTDNNRVRKVLNPSGFPRVLEGGEITTIVGGGTLRNYSPSSAPLDQPGGIAVDAAGGLYIADTYNYLIRSASNGVVATIAGSGLQGYGGDNGAATAALLALPRAVAITPTGNVFIADAGSGRVREVSNGIISTVAGNGIVGDSGDNGPATRAQLELPTGLALDSSGDLYIADSGASTVRKVSNGIITTAAGGGYLLGDNGPATSARLRNPQSVALDFSGNLYIADTGNRLVRKVSGGVISTVAGGGLSTIPAEGGIPATSADLGYVVAVAVDPSANLYILDGYNHIDIVSGGVIATIGWNGVDGFSGDGGPATSAELNGPASIAVDSSGSVYIADSLNNRIRVLIPSISSCTYAVNQLAFAPAPSGASITVTVQTSDGCSWALQKLPDWITLSGNAVRIGTGSAILVVSDNTAATRSATASIAGFSVVVTQPGGGPAAPVIYAGSLTNTASLSASVAAGSIATLSGGFPLAASLTDTSTPLLTDLLGLSLQFGGSMPAPLFSAFPGEVTLQVPWELAGQSETTLAAILNGQASGIQIQYLAPVAPGIFSVNDEGSGQGEILDSSYLLVDSSNPAAAGNTVFIYCTGLGPVTNQPPTGSPALSMPLSYTTVLPTVTIGGQPAIVSFSGLAAGYVGLYQVNVQVPTFTEEVGLIALPVVISIGGAVSNTVTIAVQQ